MSRLETCRGVVAKAHDNETYDVDLDGDRPEVGVQIPPEYLRPSVQSNRRPRATYSPGATTSSRRRRRRELRSAVADMLREREALRSRLDALTRETGTPRRRNRCPAKSHKTAAAPPGPRRSNDAHLVRHDPSLGSKDDLGAACAAALPVGTKDEVERPRASTSSSRRCRATLMVRNASPLSKRGCRAPGPRLTPIAGNSHLVVFARSTAVVKDSVKAVAAAEGRRRDRDIEERREVGLLCRLCGCI